MDPNPYGDVTKGTPSTFYGALSGSVCFPMPLMYNPMNSYPFMSGPFLPMHHTVLSQDGMLGGNDLVSQGQLDLNKADDLGSRALAYLRCQSLGKCFLPPRKSRFCLTPPSSECGKGYELNVSPPGVTYEDKECCPPSPGAEVEEPDSSGKLSADVVEQKATPRWSCDSSQPPCCPICGRTVTSPDLPDHYHMELDRFHDLVRKKEWMGQEDSKSEQMDHLRLQSYQEVEKRCPEFRKETYLRVRANRMNRLGGGVGRFGGDSSRRARKAQLCNPQQEQVSEGSSMPPAHQSMLMLELTVQQLAHRGEMKTDTASESLSSETRNISAYQGLLSANSDGYQDGSNKTGELADSSSNGFNNQERHIAAPHHPGSTRQCRVCSESYERPVVSVCCWHVHCETCWLKALGNKRVCPQCETITAPSDLRRIHL